MSIMSSVLLSHLRITPNGTYLCNTHDEHYNNIIIIGLQTHHFRFCGHFFGVLMLYMPF